MSNYWFDKESDFRWSIMVSDGEHDVGEIGIAYSEEAARKFVSQPALLAALKRVVTECYYDNEVPAYILGALKKAEGES